MAKRVFAEEERAEGRGMLHETAYEETMECMRDLIIYKIFGCTV